MANILYFWDGENWQPVSYGTGGGGTGPAGPQGPAGEDGHSIEVYGPQVDAPIAPVKGDMWLALPSARTEQGRSLPVKRLGRQSDWRPGKYSSVKKVRR
jgi:hypothetical protein